MMAISKQKKREKTTAKDVSEVEPHLVYRNQYGGCF